MACIRYFPIAPPPAGFWPGNSRFTRGGPVCRPAPELRGRLIILIDDGIATGSTMRVAVAALHEARAGPVVVAAPVAARESYLELRDVVHGFVVLALPRDFDCVREYYDDFAQTTDAELRHLLNGAGQEKLRGRPGKVRPEPRVMGSFSGKASPEFYRQSHFIFARDDYHTSHTL